MKRRFADARSNKNILEKQIKTIKIEGYKIQGYASLLKIINVEQRWFVDEENRCIQDKNYEWLQIYPNENYCITAMYDEKSNIKEWYIDICKQNGIEDGIPYEDDLYLDVVIVPDGRVHLLDEDELLEAYKKNDISKEEYDLSYRMAKEIMDKMPEKINDLKLFTDDLKNRF